jgi:hypothetical protein
LWTGGALGSTMERGAADSRRGGASQVRGTPGVTGPESSPAAAEDEEGDEVEPVRAHRGTSSDGEAVWQRQRMEAD